MGVGGQQVGQMIGNLALRFKPDDLMAPGMAAGMDYLDAGTDLEAVLYQ